MLVGSWKRGTIGKYQNGMPKVTIIFDQNLVECIENILCKTTPPLLVSQLNTFGQSSCFIIGGRMIIF